MNEVMTRMQDTKQEFLARNGWANATLSELEEKGASLRRYQRVHAGDGRTAILTYVDNVKMEITRFVEVSELLRHMGLSAPEVFAHDTQAKLLLQEDFGDESFNRLIASGTDRASLHLKAVGVLNHIQANFTAEDEAQWASKLLRYDFTQWKSGFASLSNFFMHYLPCVGAPALSVAEEAEYLDLWQKLLTPFEAVPNTLLMRDFKPANMMMIRARSGHQQVGLIDFQDAGLGSPFYDLVEITQSWQHELPDELANTVLAAYGKARPEFAPEMVRSGCMAFGAVRWVCWLSSCARYAREGRPQFLANIPGIWRAADKCLNDPALAELKRWFDHYAPAHLRAPQKVAA